MMRWVVAAVVWCSLALMLPGIAGAQSWNDARSRALVERATDVRARQLADTALRDYRATARGYLTFLAQIGEGFTEPPRIVKADQLALQVYWSAPDRSKQIIEGRRDTLLLPTDIAYHRDHLGIIQGNFPEIIRLGDGDEVGDVPHPLSRTGLDFYDFAIRDSLAIRIPGREIEVYEIAVRPRDDRQAAVIGAVYIERESAQLARMHFGFTRAAFRDQQLEDLSVVLENALVEGRYWLPLRQEIEIRRTATWLDYPVRGIIRGRWEISGYDVNVGLPDALFTGPEIVSHPPQRLRQYAWEGRVLDNLPSDVRTVTPAEVARVQAEARALVRQQALAGTRSQGIATRRVSDVVRVNRVEGFALGAGYRVRRPGGLLMTASGRYGFADQQLKGRLNVGVQRPTGLLVEVFALDDHRLLGDVPEVSLLRNSVAAQEFGSDYTSPIGIRGAGLAAEVDARWGARLRIEGARERHTRLEVNARPFHGQFAPTPPVTPLDATRVTLRLDRPASLGPWGTEIRWSGEARGLLYDEMASSAGTTGVVRGEAVRGSVMLEVERPVRDDRLVLRTFAAAVSGGDVPSQERVFLGGPTSAPGYRFHEFSARSAVSQHVEWQTRIPFFSAPLGRFGRSPASATLAPFISAVHVDAPLGRSSGVYPSIGVGLMTFFDIVRWDVARGLRDGRWRFGVDISREFWRVL